MHRRHRARSTEMRANPVEDFLDVGEEILPDMSFLRVQRILAVIAHVEHHEIVALGERQPERRIGIDRKPVAMAEHDAGGAGPPVAPAASRAFRDLRAACRTITYSQSWCFRSRCAAPPMLGPLHKSYKDGCKDWP